MGFSNEPKSFRLDSGKYWYCRCGESSQFPFCDGAHEATDEVPKKFTVSDATSVTLCMCGKSKAKPYCDGAHKHS